VNLGRAIEDLREGGYRRWGLALTGAAIGLVVATIHWIGFLVGGALIAFPQRSIARGVLAGTAFGVVTWGVFVATLAFDRTAAAYLGMGQVVLVSAAIPLVAAFLGSLVRAIR
jgi:hypothetical protein